MMDLQELRAALAGVQSVTRFYYFPEVASTSDWAKDLVTRANGSQQLDGTLVVADHQTRGRGRLNRTWISSPAKSLLFTCLRAKGKTDATVPEMNLSYALAPGLALCAAIESLPPGFQAGLKYPNDVLIEGKKVAGVLVEQVSSGGRMFVLTGIGINVNQETTELPSGTRWEAASLKGFAGCAVDRVALLCSVLENMERLYRLSPGKLLELANSKCCILGKWVRVETAMGSWEGMAERIAEDGGLILRNPSLPGQRVHTGEVVGVSMALGSPAA